MKQCIDPARTNWKKDILRKCIGRLLRHGICAVLAVTGACMGASSGHADTTLVQAAPSQAGIVQGQSALSTIERAIAEVVRINAENQGESKRVERRKLLKESLNVNFNFDEMAKRSLGVEWDKITPAEQKDFVAVFSDMLANTYLARVETAKKDTVKIDSERLDFPKSVVKTTVSDSGNKFPIDYKLINENGTWRVFDVVIENIGLVANYRNEFAGVIRKDEFSGLMKSLREKGAAQTKRLAEGTSGQG